MPRPPQPLWLRYGSAVASVALALLVRDLLAPVLHERAPFLFTYVALLFTAWYAGRGPSILAFLLGLAGGAAFLARHDGLPMTSGDYVVAVLVYCTVALASIAFSESLRLARERAEAAAAEALRQKERLEREVGERRRLEEELRRRAAELAEAHRRKDEFLAMLAHELRNPLAPVRNGLHILKQLGINGTPLEKVREIMERQVQLLTHLVDDLLDVSRITTGKIKLRKQRVSLGTVVRQAVEAATPLIEERRHELTVDLPERPLYLEADPVRLEQILVNLLNNAAKYTPEGGKVLLSARQEDGRVTVNVRDNGAGIPPEMLQRIFEPFQQADWGPADTYGGLGIGLSLVRRLAELHGGRVEVFSGGVGQGSEFVLHLPGLPAEEAHEPPRASIDTVTVPPKRRVLVVDDNEDAAKTLAMMLRLEGHEVRTANDGPTALEIARTEAPDMILLDLGMPGMDGYEVARRLRAQPSLDGVVLAALTGWGQEEDRRRTREAGFDAHLVKPVELESLKQLLNQTRCQVHEHSTGS